MKKALILLLLLIFSSLLFPIVYSSPYYNVDATTAYYMVSGGLYPDIIVLDVRTQLEYDSGHVHGAVWIPVGELEARINELAGHENHEILVYCKSGGRSAMAADILEANGFTKVYNLMGGLTSWLSFGYPVWIATVHNVDSSYSYDTIQATMDSFQKLSGHTIRVDLGVYEENLVIRKSVTLLGEDKDSVVIEGDGSIDVVTLESDYIIFSDFTVKNSGPNSNNSGILLNSVQNNVISSITITDSVNGIAVKNSQNCTIKDNSITNCTYVGVLFNMSQNNIVARNDLLDNGQGFAILNSSNNTFYQNNLIENVNQFFHDSSINVWDAGYSAGGNYWSDYNGIDLHNDSIGETPYVINEDNQDNYPLVVPFILGDLNRDFIVNSDDLFYFIGSYMEYFSVGFMNPLCDLDFSNDLDSNDLFDFIKAYIEYYD